MLYFDIPIKKLTILLHSSHTISQAYPNLYSIRGTPARDTLHWVRAVDLMRKLGPTIIVPQHTIPICGEEAAMDVLTCYRDAIQFTHDQTVRYMNKGTTVLHRNYSIV